MSTPIVSLGPYCVTKTAINNMKFDAPAMPFDWMFSSLAFVKKVLMDNFQSLMMKENIRSTNPCWSKDKSYNILYNTDILNTYTIQTHLLYKKEMPDYYNFHMWNHYNLLEEEQYNKYDKYVERFKSVYCSSEFKIFMYVHYYEDAIDEIIEFNNYLNQHVQNYTFFCINCKKVPNPSKDILCSYDKDNLYICDVDIEKWEDDIPLSSLDSIKKHIITIIHNKTGNASD